MKPYDVTVQDLLNMLNKIEDKTQSIQFVIVDKSEDVNVLEVTSVDYGEMFVGDLDLISMNLYVDKL